MDWRARAVGAIPRCGSGPDPARTGCVAGRYGAVLGRRALRIGDDAHQSGRGCTARNRTTATDPKSLVAGTDNGRNTLHRNGSLDCTEPARQADRGAGLYDCGAAIGVSDGVLLDGDADELGRILTAGEEAVLVFGRQGLEILRAIEALFGLAAICAN